MKVNIFQIFHDERTREQMNAGFEALDNTASPKPDWHEYWAIRSFFLSHSVDENEYYGFVSADFESKTSLNAEAVHTFIHDNPGHEVYTFAPFIANTSCYLNVFEQGNRIHPGFIEAAEAYLREIPFGIDLRTLVMDSRSFVLGNYIVAKPSFWQTWFALTEKLFELFERSDSAFRRCVDSTAVCDLPVDIRGLLIDRIAALVLSLCPDIKVCAFNASATPEPGSVYQPYEQQLSFLDDLKAGYLQTEDKTYLNSFHELRGAVLQACEGSRLTRAKEGFLSTQLVASPDMLYVCFTHVPPPFRYPSYVNMVNLGEVQGPGKANLRDLAAEWEPYHPQLGSLAGCFALKNYIVENRLQVRRVGMCQYRKFVSNTRISGVPAPNYCAMDVVNRETLDDAALMDFMAPGDRDFLIGAAASLHDGYYNQYTRAHVSEDFLRFTSEAIELGVLARTEVMAFFNLQVFMPGGIEVGVYPTAFWVEAISKIELVVRACVARYPGVRLGYQARNWAFCAERLGSFLLLKHMTSTYPLADWYQRFVGHLNLLTNDEHAAYVPGV